MSTSPVPFVNSLRQNDRIFDTVTQRQGKVARTPQNDGLRSTAIIYDGTTAQRYVDVMRLRLMVDGKPEDVPPVEGEPEVDAAPGKKPTPGSVAIAPDCLAVAKAQLAKNNEEKTVLNVRFKALVTENERLERVIKLLEGSE